MDNRKTYCFVSGVAPVKTFPGDIRGDSQTAGSKTEFLVIRIDLQRLFPTSPPAAFAVAYANVP
jgi:hypothetical protein